MKISDSENLCPQGNYLQLPNSGMQVKNWKKHNMKTFQSILNNMPKMKIKEDDFRNDNMYTDWIDHSKKYL